MIFDINDTSLSHAIVVKNWCSGGIHLIQQVFGSDGNGFIISTIPCPTAAAAAAPLTVGRQAHAGATAAAGLTPVDWSSIKVVSGTDATAIRSGIATSKTLLTQHGVFDRVLADRAAHGLDTPSLK